MEKTKCYARPVYVLVALALVLGLTLMLPVTNASPDGSGVPQLSVSVSPTSQSTAVGVPAEYTVTVTNTGTGNATNVQVAASSDWDISFGGAVADSTILKTYDGEYGHGYLEQRGPYKVLHVSGSPYDMGYQQGYLVGEEMLPLWSLVVTSTALMLGEGNFNAGYNLMLTAKSLIEPYVPDKYKTEMRGIADGAASVGCPLTYDDIFLMNVHVDATAAAWGKVEMNITVPYELEHEPSCSSFAIWGNATEDGKLISAGTEDWFEFSTDAFGGIGDITDGSVILMAYPDDGYPFVGTSAAGLIACCQGMNAAGVTNCQKTSSSIHETLSGLGEFFQCRELSQYADSVDKAISILGGEHQRTRGLNWQIADGKVPNSGVIEVSATEEAVRYGDTGNSLVATNNYFCYPGYEGYEGYNMVPGQLERWGMDPNMTLENWTAFIESWPDQRYETYKALIAANHGNIDAELGKYFLTQCTGVGDKNLMIPDVPFYKTNQTGDIYMQSMSVQRFVAIPEELSTWISFGGTKPETLGPYVFVNLEIPPGKSADFVISATPNEAGEDMPIDFVATCDEGVSASASITQLSNLKDKIRGLNATDFNNEHAWADQQQALLNKVDAVVEQIRAGENQGAMNKLQNDVKDKIEKWIIPEVQPKLIENVDVAFVVITADYPTE